MAQPTVPEPTGGAMSRRNPLANVPNAVNSPLQAPAVAGTKRPRPTTASSTQRDVQQPPSKRQALEAADVLKTPPKRTKNAAVDAAQVAAARRPIAVPKTRTTAPPTFTDIGAATRRTTTSTSRTTRNAGAALFADSQTSTRTGVPVFKDGSGLDFQKITKGGATLGADMKTRANAGSGLAVFKDDPKATTKPRHGLPMFKDDPKATSRQGPPLFKDDKAGLVKVGQHVKVAPETQHDNLDTVRAWQKHYRNVFPQYVFFFDDIPQEVVARATKHIASLGATTEKFFSTQVTHVITTRAVDDLTSGSRSKKSQSHPKLLVDNLKGANDVLLKAWEYGMKIWVVEKLQRVINGLLDNPISHPVLGIATSRRGQNLELANTQAAKDKLDLTNILKNERLHGPTDRDPNAVSKELIHFKGPYIYVHDIFRQHRPTMVRDYPKVPRREDGTWPQFRSVSSGKCPFVEESVHQRRERERAREKERQKAKEAKEAEEARLKEKQSRGLRKENEIIEIEDIAVPVKETRSAATKKSVGPPTLSRTANRQENDVAFTATNQKPPGQYTHEPAASGLQPSGITSAIRSRMISSHQDQPGTRAGTSKELYGLQRKVAGNVLLGNPNASTGAAVRRTAHVPAPARNVKKKLTAEEIRKLPRKKPDPKPGYCENCREKFDDFEDHCKSRKHRKFATDLKNWQELDDLLSLLVRPLKNVC